MGDLDVKGQVLETGLKVLQNKVRTDYCTMEDEKRGENSADGEQIKKRLSGGAWF